jgi:hypothetical protein
MSALSDSELDHVEHQKRSYAGKFLPVRHSLRKLSNEGPLSDSELEVHEPMESNQQEWSWKWGKMPMKSHDLEIRMDPNVPRLSQCTLGQLKSLSAEEAKVLFVQQEVNYKEFTQNLSLLQNTRNFCIFYQGK